ncbi:MAG TPA: helix-turn-helix transcriptional regulator [Fervidobacterium sp.]|nr:helix-turn-helix transcriptional regulator [Fervidobacterium sp.]
MTFGEKLTTLRKQHGLSQEDLAEKLSVSRQAISRWELDSTLPDAENLLQISKLFGVSVDYLINDDYESENDTPAAYKVVQKMELSGKLNSAYMMSVGGIAIFTLIGIGLWITYQNATSVIVSAVGDLLVIVLYELFLSKYAEDDHKLWSNKFVRSAIWLVMAFPGFWIVSRLVHVYPRPYSSLTLWTICIAVYLVVCSLTTFVFAKR